LWTRSLLASNDKGLALIQTGRHTCTQTHTYIKTHRLRHKQTHTGTHADKHKLTDINTDTQTHIYSFMP
jgi:hypothetical protein